MASADSPASLQKIFNYVLKHLYLGCQWKELPIDKAGGGRPETHYTRIYSRLTPGLAYRMDANGRPGTLSSPGVRTLCQLMDG